MPQLQVYEAADTETRDPETYSSAPGLGLLTCCGMSGFLCQSLATRPSSLDEPLKKPNMQNSKP